MKHFASVFMSFAASAALIAPLSIMPKGVENCANDSYKFATIADTTAHHQAAAVAKMKFCSVVKASL